MSDLEKLLSDVNRNKLALILSVVPGLGHLYKRHYVAGLGILVPGNALMVFAAAWLAIATLGLALVVVPLLWVGGVAWSAYLLPDRHRAGIATPAPVLSEEGALTDPAEERLRVDKRTIG